MYDGRDNNNSQTNSSTKYISNTYGGVINIYFRVCVRIFDR